VRRARLDRGGADAPSSPPPPSFPIARRAHSRPRYADLDDWLYVLLAALAAAVALRCCCKCVSCARDCCCAKGRRGRRAARSPRYAKLRRDELERELERLRRGGDDDDDDDDDEILRTY